MAFNLQGTLTNTGTAPDTGAVSPAPSVTPRPQAPPPPVVKFDAGKTMQSALNVRPRQAQSLSPSTLRDALTSSANYNLEGKPLTPTAMAVDWLEKMRRETFAGNATEDESRVAEAFRKSAPNFNEKMNDKAVVKYLYANHPNLAPSKDNTAITDEQRLAVLKELYGVEDAPKAPEEERPLPEKIIRGIGGFAGQVVGGIKDRFAGLAAAPVLDFNRLKSFDRLQALKSEYRRLTNSGLGQEHPAVKDVLGRMTKEANTYEDLSSAVDFATNMWQSEGAGWALGTGEAKTVGEVAAVGGKVVAREIPFFSAQATKAAQWAETVAKKSGAGAWFWRNIMSPALHGGTQLAGAEAIRSAAFGDTAEDAASRISTGFAQGMVVSPLFHAGGTLLRKVVGAGGPTALLEDGIKRNFSAHLDDLATVPFDPSLPTHREATRIVEEKFPGASATAEGQRLIKEFGSRIDATVKLNPIDFIIKQKFIEEELPTLLDRFKPDLSKPANEEAVRILRAHLSEVAQKNQLPENLASQWADEAMHELDRLPLVEDKIKAAQKANPAAAVPNEKVIPTPDTAPAPGEPKVINAQTPDSDLPSTIVDPNTRLEIPIKARGNKPGARLNQLIRTYKNTAEESNPALKEALWREIHAAYNNGRYPSPEFNGQMPKGLEPPSWRRPAAEGAVVPPATPKKLPDTPAPGETPQQINGQPATVQQAFNPDVTVDGTFRPMDINSPDTVVRPATFRDLLTDFLSEGLDKVVRRATGPDAMTYSTLRRQFSDMLVNAGFHPTDVNAIQRADGTIEYVTLDRYVDNFIRSVVDHKLYEDPSWGRFFNPLAETYGDKALQQDASVLAGIIAERRNPVPPGSPDFGALAEQEADRIRALEQASTPETPEGVPTEDAWSRYARQQKLQHEMEQEEARRLAEVAARESEANAEQQQAADAAAENERWIWSTVNELERRSRLERETRPQRIAEQKKLNELARAQASARRQLLLALEGETGAAPYKAPELKLDEETARLRKVYGGAFDNLNNLSEKELAEMGFWRNPYGGVEVSPLLTAQKAERQMIATRTKAALASIGGQATTPAGKPISNMRVVKNTKVHVKMNQAGDALAVGARGGKVRDEVMSEIISLAHSSNTAVEVTLTPVNVKGKPVDFDATRLAELRARGFYPREVSATEMVLRLDPPRPDVTPVSTLDALQITNGDVSGAKTYMGMDVRDALALSGASEPGSPLVP